jgi:hypothetical protein
MVVGTGADESVLTDLKSETTGRKRKKKEQFTVLFVDVY